MVLHHCVSFEAESASPCVGLDVTESSQVQQCHNSKPEIVQLTVDILVDGRQCFYVPLVKAFFLYSDKPTGQ